MVTVCINSIYGRYSRLLLLGSLYVSPPRSTSRTHAAINTYITPREGGVGGILEGNRFSSTTSRRTMARRLPTPPPPPPLARTLKGFEKVDGDHRRRRAARKALWVPAQHPTTIILRAQLISLSRHKEMHLREDNLDN